MHRNAPMGVCAPITLCLLVGRWGWLGDPKRLNLCSMHAKHICAILNTGVSVGEYLPGVRPARYFSINYPDFSPRFTLSWTNPPSRPRCTTHLPYKARCIIKQ